MTDRGVDDAFQTGTVEVRATVEESGSIEGAGRTTASVSSISKISSMVDDAWAVMTGLTPGLFDTDAVLDCLRFDGSGDSGASLRAGNLEDGIMGSGMSCRASQSP
jgi:hypothetical protein